ncbi:tyrosine-type recombinase/integrase [Haloarchaeobius litoreus]|uniref:Tyrosine-type recombinase/integrase n=1 Tax=Haloarchaeobius litoreus TaxID=755306 RepID=A0ABD6DGQ3_9EURY|nr:tyrosine-type recombinase/integrase [Haloarchaeobius litoreus]
MDDWIDRHLERVKAKKAESSYETHYSNLKNFNCWLENQDERLTELRTLDLEDYFLEQMEQGYAPNTIASRYESVRALFNRLSGRFEAIEENPFEDLERKEFVEKDTKKHNNADLVYVTPDEKEAMCENAPAPRLRNELIIRLMWQTGIRKVELNEIELDDLDREERRIEVWSNKSKEWRSVFYQPSLDILLDQWLDNGHRDSYMPAASSPYLFVTERSEQLHDSTVTDKVVKPAAEAAGIQEVMYQDQGGCKRYRVTPHALRHGHAVTALKSDIDVRRVQQHLGHSSLDITMEYLQFIDEDVKEAYDRFGRKD